VVLSSVAKLPTVTLELEQGQKKGKGNFSWPRLVTQPLLGGHLQSAGDMVKAHTKVAAQP